MQNKTLFVFLVLALGVLVASKHSQEGSASPSLPSPDQVLHLIRNSTASQLQTQIDKEVSEISGFLTDPKNQDLIRNVTRRANNLIRLVNLQPIRRAAHSIVNKVFSSLTELHGNLTSQLQALNTSKNPINDLKELLQYVALDAFLQFHSINETAQEALRNLTQDLSNGPISSADNETLSDVQAIIGGLVNQLSENTEQQLAKYKVIAKILSLQSNALSANERRRLESSIRSQANQLARELRGLNISNLHGLTTNVINGVLDRVEGVLDQASSLANRALASETPGNVINNALLELKVNLGRRIQQFQRNTERDLQRFVRDTLNSLNIRSIRGNNLNEVLQSAQTRIQARVGEIVSLVNRVLAV
jgi:hypothetical protein